MLENHRVAGIVYDWFGYRFDDSSQAAASAAAGHDCPGVPGPCSKPDNLGGCAVESAQQQVIICPKRLYVRGHHFLREIAHQAFASFDLTRASDGLPELCKGSLAKQRALTKGKAQVGVFGHE
ncbi:NotI family restriction endonuclease, partial [Mycobacteroides abscessus]|uniref:NotI family restriction endonuclease n=1 Tax=Mycobacteroides abscessus TaxID=36809 RepID=UPI0019D1C164